MKKEDEEGRWRRRGCVKEDEDKQWMWVDVIQYTTMKLYESK